MQTFHAFGQCTNKGQKQKGPNRRRRDQELPRKHRRTTQKDLNDPDNHNGVITLLQPDILESEVK